MKTIDCQGSLEFSVQFLRHLFLDRSSRTFRKDLTIQVARRRERLRLENYPDALIASSGEEERQRSGEEGGRRKGDDAREDLKEDAWVDWAKGLQRALAGLSSSRIYTPGRVPLPLSLASL